MTPASFGRDLHAHLEQTREKLALAARAHGGHDAAAPVIDSAIPTGSVKFSLTALGLTDGIM